MIYVDQGRDDQGNGQESMLYGDAVMKLIVTGAPAFSDFSALSWRGRFLACVRMDEAFQHFIVHLFYIALFVAWHG